MYIHVLYQTRAAAVPSVAMDIKPGEASAFQQKWGQGQTKALVYDIIQKLERESVVGMLSFVLLHFLK